MKKALLITVCATVMMMAQKASAIPTRCDEYDYDNCYEIFVDDEGYTHKIHYGYDAGEGDEGDLEHYDMILDETVYNSDGKPIKEYQAEDYGGSYSSDNMFQTAAYEYKDGKLTQKISYAQTWTCDDVFCRTTEWFDDQGKKIKEESFSLRGTSTKFYTDNGYIENVVPSTTHWDALKEETSIWTNDENEIKYDSNGNIMIFGSSSAGNIIMFGSSVSRKEMNFTTEEAFFTSEWIKRCEDWNWLSNGFGLSDNAIGVNLPIDSNYSTFILDGDKIVVWSPTEGYAPSSPDWDEMMSYYPETKDAYNKLSLVTEGNVKKVMYDGEVLYEITYDSNGKITNVKDRQGTDYAGTFNFNEYVANLNKKTTEVKNPDGSYTIYDKDGNFLGFKGKRIYTVEEANLVAKPTGNTIRIKYH